MRYGEIRGFISARNQIGSISGCANMITVTIKL